MKRKNVMAWTDCVYLNRLVLTLQEELMEYAVHVDNRMGGDQRVMIAMINLRNKMEVLLEKSKAAGN